jgi:predicted GIY-YIG superfamily endonuclease
VKTYWVYMLRCADDSYYVGVTSRLDARVAEHRAGLKPSAYTYIRRPVTLVYEQSFANVDDAIAAEKRIKGWSRAKKDALVRGDWNAIRRLAAGTEPSSHAHPSTGSG